MAKGLARSVGVGGANEKRDVKLVQLYLNSFVENSLTATTLVEDGLIGPNTIDAIKNFQKNSVGMHYPDGRVDPNGKTFRYLTMYFSELEQRNIESSLASHTWRFSPVSVTSQKIDALAGLDQITVSYGNVPSERKIVDSYSINVVKLALKESGMSHAVITSTFRTPYQQAAVMLKNAKKDLKAQFRLYGENGDEILKVYANQRSKSDVDITTLMAKKISELNTRGRYVSKHCVSAEDYRKFNIFDIGVNSTRAVCKGFNTAKFTGALSELVTEGYIEKMIDETGKSNSCWHIEIVPNKKNLREYAKNSILKPVRYI